MVDRLKLDEDPLGITVDQTRFRNIRLRLPKRTLKHLNGSYRYLEEPSNWGSYGFERHRYGTKTPMQMQPCRRALRSQQQRLNTLPCLEVVLRYFERDHSLQTTSLSSIRFPCIVTIAVILPLLYKWRMCNVNAPAEQAPVMAPPTRTDDQILPRNRWVVIGKSNCYLDVKRDLKRQRGSLVLQILCGVVNRSHIDYAERMWEEFTQSIHTFIEDKKNLAQHTQGKKKATLIVIPSAKPTKPNSQAKQSKPLTPKAAPITKPAASKSQQPKPAHAKPQEKKRKLVTETSEAPSPAKRSKVGKVTKKRKPKSSNTVDEVKLKEVPRCAKRGPLPPVVFREPDSRKFQPLLEVQDQYIFQRRTSTQTEPSGHDESSSLYAELGLTGSETDSNEEVPGIVARVQDVGQAEPNPGKHDEGHAGPNLGDDEAS
ncbi:hypothetical protein Tco_0448577 [Tanacetum coccineum]